MIDDGLEKPKGRFTRDMDERLVEELFRLAEIVQSASGEHDAERQRIAAQRMADILQESRDNNPPQPPRNPQHRWILDVLLDLIAYAETHNLGEIDRVLSDTRFKASQILSRKD
jgi:hypothetical protein